MINVYLYYPRSRVCVHHDPECAEIQKTQKVQQWQVQINPQTISSELQRFLNHQHQFESDAQGNDMWVEIDFDDTPFEEAVLQYIQRLLGGRYRGLGAAVIEEHC